MSHGNAAHHHRHALDEHENHTADERVLECDGETATDGQDAACEEAGDYGVVRIVLLSEVDHQAVYGAEDPAPHGEGATQEGGTVANVEETTQESLAARGIPDA